jgi:dynein heavy chain
MLCAAGFAGELTMSEKMEGLMNAIYMDKLPASWIKLSWPSLRPLSGMHTQHHEM